MPNPPQLIYCYDPMCSWCWGFRPSWLSLQQKLQPLVEAGRLSIHPILGGLAADSDQPMPREMREKLQSVWQHIESLLGTEFNYNFWTACQPRRSTYPACRACLVARDQGLEAELNAEIQRAYYLQAKNPSDLDCLRDCAEKIGMSGSNFLQSMAETKETGRLESEIRQARKMGLNSFPSLAVVTDNRIAHINIDYKEPDMMLAEIKQALDQLPS